VSVSSISRSDPPRGRPFGGGGVHRNMEGSDREVYSLSLFYLPFLEAPPLPRRVNQQSFRLRTFPGIWDVMRPPYKDDDNDAEYKRGQVNRLVPEHRERRRQLRHKRRSVPGNAGHVHPDRKNALEKRYPDDQPHVTHRHHDTRPVADCIRRTVAHDQPGVRAEECGRGDPGDNHPGNDKDNERHGIEREKDQKPGRCETHGNNGDGKTPVPVGKAAGCGSDNDRNQCRHRHDQSCQERVKVTRIDQVQGHQVGDPGKERRYNQAGEDTELEVPVPYKGRVDQGIRVVVFPQDKDRPDNEPGHKEQQQVNIRCAGHLVERERGKKEDKRDDKE